MQRNDEDISLENLSAIEHTYPNLYGVILGRSTLKWSNLQKANLDLLESILTANPAISIIMTNARHQFTIAQIFKINALGQLPLLTDLLQHSDYIAYLDRADIKNADFFQFLTKNNAEKKALSAGLGAIEIPPTFVVTAMTAMATSLKEAATQPSLPPYNTAASPASYNSLLASEISLTAGIRKLFRDYANPGFLTFHWNRHHRGLANNIAAQLPNDIEAARQMLKGHYNTLVKQPDVNVNGSMMRRISHALTLLDAEALNIYQTSLKQ
jgi:hypothetical protein